MKSGQPVLIEPLDAGAQAAAEVLQAANTRELGPGESCTIGPVP
jgi:hypothetical protein